MSVVWKQNDGVLVGAAAHRGANSLLWAIATGVLIARQGLQRLAHGRLHSPCSRPIRHAFAT